MIAFSDQDGADKGGETGSNFFMECCNDGEACDTWTGALSFPRKNCQMLGMALGKLFYVISYHTRFKLHFCGI